MNKQASLRQNIIRNTSVQIGFCIMFVFIVAMILSPILQSPLMQSLGNRLLPFNSPQLILGTDHFGRDILSRIIAGAFVSLRVGILASSISMIIGVLLGLLSGYFGGKVDMLIMRFTDIMMAFPVLLFLIAISATFNPGIDTALFAIGCVSWPPMARLMRGQVLSIRSKEFVQSANAMGYSHFRVVFHHILPNCIAPIIVTFTLGISGAIMAESSLSFLGLGVQPPTPSWGAMINEGKDFLRVAPSLSLFPGFAIALTVLAFNLIGEGLRDILDVKQSEGNK